jgi:subtilisin family serine protease
MPEQHIILRSGSTSTRDVFLGPFTPGGGAASFEPLEATNNIAVSVQEIDRSELSSVASNNDVVAIAPAIPMHLIEPFDVDAQAEAANQGIAWGIKAVKADASPFTGKGIVVAILDTGIDSSHPAFSGVNIVQKDFTGEGDGDKNGHGTHCAGTVFGRDVDGTRIGVARGVEKVLIGKVLGQQGGGSSAMIVSAIQWAVDNGAHVISMSLGIDFPGFVKQLEANGLPTKIAATRALEGYRANVQLFGSLASFVQARGQGGFGQPCIIVAAAGNESLRDENPTFEVAVSPPAVSEGIISVAALGQGPNGLTVAPFSNTFAQISGPGVAILSAKPGGGLKTLSGTSMATPCVAGVAALWAEKLKSAGMLNSRLLTSRLIASGTTAGLKANLDPFDVGSGLVQAPQS